MIRESDKGGYVLFVKDGDMVKYYKIRKIEFGSFFIVYNNLFSILLDLV